MMGFRLHPRHAILTSRYTNSSSHGLCVDLDAGNIVIDKKALFAGVAVCVIVTCASILGLLIVLYREWARRQETQKAKTWGRKSRFDQRISAMRKDIDGEYSRQYSGCLYQEPENPYVGDDDPVELGHSEGICEAPAVPNQAVQSERSKAKRMTLFFDHAVGMWLPKR